MIDTTAAIEYLRRDEWTMGNGQCPECYGSSPYVQWWTTTIGHRGDCALANALLELGEQVAMEQPNENTPPMTKAMRAWEAEMDRAFYCAVPIKIDLP